MAEKKKRYFSRVPKTKELALRVAGLAHELEAGKREKFTDCKETAYNVNKKAFLFVCKSVRRLAAQGIRQESALDILEDKNRGKKRLETGVYKKFIGQSAEYETIPCVNFDYAIERKADLRSQSIEALFDKKTKKETLYAIISRHVDKEKINELLSGGFPSYRTERKQYDELSYLTKKFVGLTITEFKKLFGIKVSGNVEFTAKDFYELLCNYQYRITHKNDRDTDF